MNLVKTINNYGTKMQWRCSRLSSLEKQCNVAKKNKIEKNQLKTKLKDKLKQKGTLKLERFFDDATASYRWLQLIQWVSRQTEL